MDALLQVTNLQQSLLHCYVFFLVFSGTCDLFVNLHEHWKTVEISQKESGKGYKKAEVLCCFCCSIKADHYTTSLACFYLLQV